MLGPETRLGSFFFFSLGRYTGIKARTKEEWTCDVGFERFLAPEIFFNPEIQNCAP